MALHTCCWLKSVAHVLVVLECCCSGGVWHFQVMDSLVVSLSKFTFPLNPLAFKPVVTFGENEKARVATEAVFTVANRYARAFHKHCFPPNSSKKCSRRPGLLQKLSLQSPTGIPGHSTDINSPLFVKRLFLGGKKGMSND